MPMVDPNHVNMSQALPFAHDDQVRSHGAHRSLGHAQRVCGRWATLNAVRALGDASCKTCKC